MKITRRQLRRIIREAVDVLNSETGELMIFDDVAQGADAPEAAAAEIFRRLKITPLSKEIDPGDDPVADEIEMWEVTPEDFAVLDTEIHGKRKYRSIKKREARLDIDSLMNRVDQWAADAGGDYAADNPNVDMQDVARDLAAVAEYEFEEDEWDKLISSFDYEEDALVDYIAGSIVG